MAYEREYRIFERTSVLQGWPRYRVGEPLKYVLTASKIIRREVTELLYTGQNAYICVT